MFTATTTRVKVMLSKMGGEAVHRRKAQGSVDALNHNTGSYEDTGTVLCAPYNPSSDSQQTAAGELDLNQPLFAVPGDVDLRQNDRLVYQQTVYEVESVTNRAHYQIAQTKET